LAQRPAVPAVGFLSLLPEATLREQLNSFGEGLAELGQVVGRTLTMEYRWADGDSSRLAGLATELIRLQPALIVAAGGNVAAAAAKAATSTIPIVFTAVRDPVQDRLVASLNRPGGNITGVSILAEELDAKRLDLLHELAPSAGPIGVLINANNPTAEVQRGALQAAARAIGRSLVIRLPGTPEEIDLAFEAFSAAGATGVIAVSDPWFTSQRWRTRAISTGRPTCAGQGCSARRLRSSSRSAQSISNTCRGRSPRSSNSRAAFRATTPPMELPIS